MPKAVSSTLWTLPSICRPEVVQRAHTVFASPYHRMLPTTAGRSLRCFGGEIGNTVVLAHDDDEAGYLEAAKVGGDARRLPALAQMGMTTISRLRWMVGTASCP